jgi:hypothetical protein
MRGKWTAGLGAALGLWVAGAGAEEFGWRPAAAQLAPPAAAAPALAPAVTLGRPVASLGRPVPLGAAPDGGIAAVNYAPPASSGAVIRAQAPDAGPPAVPPPGVPAVPGGEGFVPGGPAAEPAPPAGTGFWAKTGEFFGFGAPCPGRCLFQSDHCFDGFISPVSNPSEFEDPRSLTEIRPVFIYEQAPLKNSIFHGGDIEFFGVQARLALTDRLSIVMQNLGWDWIEPHAAEDGFAPHTGFSEIDIGPKFTFWRNECTKTLAAAGLTFEIPVGSKKVFENTGNLSLRPYLSFAQNFGQTSWGSFNFMSTWGYNFSMDNERSDSLFASWHLDFNIGNANKIYPLLELNWRHYTANGHANPVNFEGGDLINFGATNISGHDLVTLAPGVRYKFTEWAQVGTAVEFPITNPSKDIEAFRVTFDVIFRY